MSTGKSQTGLLIKLRKLNNNVEKFFQKPGKWQEIYIKLREIVLESGLDEDYKWMHPYYTLNGKNVVLIHEFKEYCALLFFKGALLKDPGGILIQQTENVQAGRQIRFTNLHQIVELCPSGNLIFNKLSEWKKMV